MGASSYTSNITHVHHYPQRSISTADVSMKIFETLACDDRQSDMNKLILALIENPDSLTWRSECMRRSARCGFGLFSHQHLKISPSAFFTFTLSATSRRCWSTSQINSYNLHSIRSAVNTARGSYCFCVYRVTAETKNTLLTPRSSTCSIHRYFQRSVALPWALLTNIRN